MSYVNVIKIAIFVFPIVCLLLTLPFVIFHYRKYGTVSFFRCFILYSFFFYLLCTYFLVILPLPSKAEVAKYTSAYYNLKPFFVMKEILVSGQFSFSNPDSYIFMFNEYYEPLFNILMLIPFGIYMRYYFKCGFFKTMFLSFCLSLFFELTQLSGLYFIYPRPYRLFEINDLINNTTGGIIGFLISPLFYFFLPSRDNIDSSDYLKGNYVSVLRNGFAVLIDYIIIFVLCAGVYYIFKFKQIFYVYLFLNFLYFVFISYVSSGYTFGKWFLKVRNIGNNEDGSISIFRYFLRWLFLHLLIFNGWVLLLIFNSGVENNNYYIWFVYFVVLFIFIVYSLICFILKEDIFINKVLNIDSVSITSIDEEDFYEI